MKDSNFFTRSKTFLLKDKKFSTKEILTHWSYFDLKIIFEGILIGGLSGLIVVFFRLCLDWMDSKRYAFIENMHVNIFTVIMVFSVLVALGVVLGVFVEKAPNIKGSGIPQIKGFLIRQVKLEGLKELVLKFIGGVISLGVGLSAGREGPSVQLGATMGLCFSKLFKRFHVEEKYLVTAGASAGLAAAFNAPLAGVLFAIEELHRNVSPIMLTCILSAAVTGDFVAGTVFGLDPVLHLEDMPDLPFVFYGLIIALGIVSAIGGKAFNFLLIKMMAWMDNIKIKKRYLPIFPMMFAGVLFFTKPELLGGGHHLILQLAQGDFMIKTVLLIFAVKLVFTTLTYSSKVPGGIFLPLLLLGAIIGYVIGEIGIIGFGMDTGYLLNFIALGMVGFFTAVVKAPLSGSVLISEMTGSFDHLLPIILVALVSHVVTDIIRSKPIYDELLENMLEQSEGAPDSNFLKKSEERKSLIEIPVVYGSQVEHQRISEVKWPDKCLIVSIKRGEQELIPKGSYKIYAGDHLVFLTEYCKDPYLIEKLNRMANEISKTKHRKLSIG